MAHMAEQKTRRTRRSFTEDYKTAAVRLVLDEGKTVAAAARDLGLTESSLRNWVERARADRTQGKTGLTTAEREELTRLRKDVRELRMERDVLKNESRALARLVGQKLRGVRLAARGCGRSLSGDITNPLKNMVRGWPAHVSVVTPQSDPV